MDICKVCGKPIVVNQNDSDVFEGMHWICFHMLFEHGDYDPDEACDDPSCPWNRISGKDVHIIYRHSELKFIPSDLSAGIFLTKKSIENKYLPSIEFQLNITDELLKNYSYNIWTEKDMLLKFRDELERILISGKGVASFDSISPDELMLQIETLDKSGHLVVTYKVSKRKLFTQFNKKVAYENTFEIEFNMLNKYLNQINCLLKVFEK